MLPLLCWLIAALLAPALFASPFDPRFVITTGELCADGDLALSIPLARIRLDETVTLALRAEHTLKTGDYGFAQSEIILRPLTTTLAPYDRDALAWRKPNGDKVTLRKSTSAARLPPANMPAEAEKFLDTLKTCQTYESRDATAWLDDDSPAHGLVYSENMAFCYTNGALTCLILPSGARVAVKSEGGMIREMRIGDAPLFNFEQITDTETRITAGARQFTLRYNRGRIVEITRLPATNPPSTNLPATKLAAFDYDPDGLLSAATSNGKQSHYAWAETKRPLPAIITWVNSRHLQSTDGKRFDYLVTDDTIVMSAYAGDTLQKTTTLRVRYGTIISIRETKGRAASPRPPQ